MTQNAHANRSLPFVIVTSNILLTITLLPLQKHVSIFINDYIHFVGYIKNKLFILLIYLGSPAPMPFHMLPIVEMMPHDFLSTVHSIPPLQCDMFYMLVKFANVSEYIAEFVLK